MSNLAENIVVDESAVEVSVDTDINSDDLNSIARKIKFEIKAADASLNQGRLRAKRVGELLVQAKERMKHGEWTRWLERYCDLSDRRAQQYMRLYKHWDKVKEITEGSFGFDLDRVLRALSKPEESEEEKAKKEAEKEAEEQARKQERLVKRQAAKQKEKKEAVTKSNAPFDAYQAKQKRDRQVQLDALSKPGGGEESKPSEEYKELKQRWEQLIEICSSTSNDTLTCVKDNPKAFSEKEFDEITDLVNRAKHKLFTALQSLLIIREQNYPEVEETLESEELNDNAVAEYAEQQQVRTYKYLDEEAA